RPVTGQKVENTRVEIILPTGGLHQAKIEQRHWTDLLGKVASQWDNQNRENINSIPPGNRLDLVSDIHKQTGSPADEIEKFIDANYKVGTKKKDLTSEKFWNIRGKLPQ